MLQSWKVGQTFLTALIDTLEAELKRHETKIRARNYLVRVGTKFLHHSFKAKKRPCLGGGKHDRSYVSAPRCVSGGEEAKRVLADIAREEVSAVSGIFGSTREEVSGSKTGV